MVEERIIELYGAKISVFSDGSFWVHRGSRNKRRFGYTTRKGYKATLIRDCGKERTVYVHKLVGLAFIPNPDNKPQINHINGDKTDNRPENLEWCTHKYNLDYRSTNGAYAISEETLNAMFAMYDHGTPIKHIAAKLGIGCIRVGKIIRTKRQTKPNWVYRDKYHIPKEELKQMFDDGMGNQQIAEYYHCPVSLIARRKYQYRKGEY